MLKFCFWCGFVLFINSQPASQSYTICPSSETWLRLGCVPVAMPNAIHNFSIYTWIVINYDENECLHADIVVKLKRKKNQGMKKDIETKQRTCQQQQQQLDNRNMNKNKSMKSECKYELIFMVGIFLNLFVLLMLLVAVFEDRKNLYIWPTSLLISASNFNFINLNICIRKKISMHDRLFHKIYIFKTFDRHYALRTAIMTNSMCAHRKDRSGRASAHQIDTSCFWKMCAHFSCSMFDLASSLLSITRIRSQSIFMNYEFMFYNWDEYSWLCVCLFSGRMRRMAWPISHRAMWNTIHFHFVCFLFVLFVFFCEWNRTHWMF